MSNGARPGEAPTIIDPVDFRTTPRKPRRRRPLRQWLALLVGVMFILCLAVAGWFVLTARQVQLTLDPLADRLELRGPPLRFRIAEHWLLRPGTYTVHASRQGYHPLIESFAVQPAKDNSFHFAFKELPGIVTLRCVGADDPDTPLGQADVRIDGRTSGQAPLQNVELPGGAHAVLLQRERYQDLETEILVEGRGHREVVTLQLLPDWADVEIETRPVSAELWIDGAPITATPCRVEVPSGPRELELRAEGFETWRRRLVIIAEQPVSLIDIVLAPAKGRLTVETEPSAAQVLVDGQFAGTSPVEVAAEPDRDLVVQVARAGYEPARRTIRLAPQQAITVAFDLTPQHGTVHLEVFPADSILHVDGAAWGTVPTEITLLAVEHRLEFKKEGFVTAVRTITPRPGVTHKITVDLEQIKSEAPPGVKTWTAANGYPFILIRPATYTMGASRREPGRRSNETLRKIQLQRPFYMGTREVTNTEFRAFMGEHRSGETDDLGLGGADRPVVHVTWDDAARFCNWLSAQDQLPLAYVEQEGGMRAVQPVTTGYRLPTEAEWGYGARVNASTALLKYPWGPAYPPNAKSGNFADESAAHILNVTIPGYEDGYAASAPVAAFKPNAFGLHDLGGNVAEWCHDFYTIYPYDAHKVYIDPMGPTRGQHHVVRGSSWRHASSSVLRYSYRDYSAQTRDDLGFRMCRYLTGAEASNAHHLHD